jgi:predicted TPR repeat methyltransferase
MKQTPPSDEQRMQQAFALHKSKQFKQAKSLYLQLIDSSLDHVCQAMVHNNLASILMQEYQYDAAIDHLHNAIELKSDYQDAFYNLALAYKKQQNYLEAIHYWQQLLQLHPQHHAAQQQIADCYFLQENYLNALEYYLSLIAEGLSDSQLLFNTATCYLQLSELDKATTYYLQAQQYNNQDPELFYNLGVIKLRQQALDQAKTYFEQCLQFAPQHSPALTNLGAIAFKQNQSKQAIDYYQQALKADPHNKTVQFLLHALQGNKQIGHAPTEYVQHLFDNYSEYFEQHLLGELDYQLPEILREQLTQLWSHPQANKTIADLGCGSGLIGQVVKPYAKRLVGVDLSRAMLVKAEAKNIYDVLFHEEITTF